MIYNKGPKHAIVSYNKPLVPILVIVLEVGQITFSVIFSGSV